MIVERYTRNKRLSLSNVSPKRQPKGDTPYEKPVGNWISIPGEDDWPSWCRSEGYNLPAALRYCHRLNLDTNAVKVISSIAEIDAFTDEWLVTTPLGQDITFFNLAWDKIAERYKGVVIAPYIWARRLSPPKVSNWYYTWDCASGCIWDISCLTYISSERNSD